MAKKVVKNTCNRPIYLNLPGGRSQKIRARDTAEIDEADFNCHAITFHQSRGHLVVLDSPKAPETEGD